MGCRKLPASSAEALRGSTTIGGETARSCRRGRSIVTGTQQGWPRAARCSVFLGLAQTLRSAAAVVCKEEGGKLGKPGGCPGQWGCGARATGCCDSRETPGSAQSWVSLPPGGGTLGALSISGLPEGRAMPMLPPGRKSLTVTPCFKHSLVKAFPWQNARQWSLPSLQLSRTLSSLLHLLHPLSNATAPAMGNPSCLPAFLPFPHPP